MATKERAVLVIILCTSRQRRAVRRPCTGLINASGLLLIWKHAKQVSSLPLQSPYLCGLTLGHPRISRSLTHARPPVRPPARPPMKLNTRTYIGHHRIHVCMPPSTVSVGAFCCCPSPLCFRLLLQAPRSLAVVLGPRSLAVAQSPRPSYASKMIPDACSSVQDDIDTSILHGWQGHHHRGRMSQCSSRAQQDLRYSTQIHTHAKHAHTQPHMHACIYVCTCMQAWSGPNNHAFCLYAADGRNKVRDNAIFFTLRTNTDRCTSTLRGLKLLQLHQTPNMPRCASKV